MSFWLLRRFTQATSNPDSRPSDDEDVLSDDIRKIEGAWRQFNAIGKGESGYGRIYAEIFRDIPPVTNVLELGIAGGALFAPGRLYGQKLQSLASISTRKQP